jgi:hypothetical protein
LLTRDDRSELSRTHIYAASNAQLRQRLPPASRRVSLLDWCNPCKPRHHHVPLLLPTCHRFFLLYMPPSPLLSTSLHSPHPLSTSLDNPIELHITAGSSAASEGRRGRKAMGDRGGYGGQHWRSIGRANLGDRPPYETKLSSLPSSN